MWHAWGRHPGGRGAVGVQWAEVPDPVVGGLQSGSPGRMLSLHRHDLMYNVTVYVTLYVPLLYEMHMHRIQLNVVAGKSLGVDFQCLTRHFLLPVCRRAKPSCILFVLHCCYAPPAVASIAASFLHDALSLRQLLKRRCAGKQHCMQPVPVVAEHGE